MNGRVVVQGEQHHNVRYYKLDFSLHCSKHRPVLFVFPLLLCFAISTVSLSHPATTGSQSPADAQHAPPWPTPTPTQALHRRLPPPARSAGNHPSHPTPPLLCSLSLSMFLSFLPAFWDTTSHPPPRSSTGGASTSRQKPLSRPGGQRDPKTPSFG